ncbi:hypothetical protein D9M68_995690 [compost metagenome]
MALDRPDSQVFDRKLRPKALTMDARPTSGSFDILATSAAIPIRLANGSKRE